jgi:hypothetical protein
MTLAFGSSVTFVGPAAADSVTDADLSAYVSDAVQKLGVDQPSTMHLAVSTTSDADVPATVNFSVSSGDATLEASQSGTSCVGASRCPVSVPAWGGAEVSVPFTVTAHSAGTIVITANVQPQGTDPSPDDNTDTVTLQATAPRATQWRDVTIEHGERDTTVVRGTVTYADTGAPVDSASVSLLRRATGTSEPWTTVYTRTVSGGAASLSDGGGIAYDYALAVLATEALLASESSAVHGSADPPAVSITMPGTAIAGHQLTISGHAANAAHPLPADAKVVLLRKLWNESQFLQRATDSLSPSGDVTFYDVASENATYAVQVPTSWGNGLAEQAVGVTPGVQVWVSSATMVPRGTVNTYTARVAGASGTVQFQKYSGGAWQAVATRTLNAQHIASVGISTTSLGQLKVRALAPSTQAHLAGTSGAAAVSVVTAGPGDPRDYKILRTWNGHPQRWNPCQVVTYRTDLRYAPPGAAADLKEAIRRLTLATGITFRDVGATTWQPRADFRGWPGTSAVVISWTPHNPEAPSSSWGPDSGMGDPWAFNGGRWFTRGWVAYSARMTGEAGFGQYGRGSLLLHELGHLVGLDHASGSTEMMHSGGWTSPASLYGAGDIRGLQLLGRSAGC